MEKLFKKYKNNPVLGKSELGTCFDVYVTKDEGRFRMDFSWRKYNSCAVSFSDDGINWSDPFITLAHRPESGWEERVNRNCVLKIDGKYKMWYTGQAREYSFIGYENIDKAQICFARSDNGITGWTKFIDNPVICLQNVNGMPMPAISPRFYGMKKRNNGCFGITADAVMMNI